MTKNTQNAEEREREGKKFLCADGKRRRKGKNERRRRRAGQERKV